MAVHETAHITMAAIAELMRRNIPLIIHSATDAILGRCAPGEVLCKMIRDIQLSKPSDWRQALAQWEQEHTLDRVVLGVAE